jgi:hypothetical protein
MGTARIQDAAISAARRKRTQRLREEQREDWDRFKSLTRTLVRTPKDKTPKS